MTNVIKIEDLKIENIRLSQVKVNKRGGKMVYINYVYNQNEDPKKLRFQLPKMKAPFGVSGWSIDGSGKSSSIPNENSNDAIELAFNSFEEPALRKIEELEEFIIKNAFENSKEFFNKKKPLDACKMFFTTGVRHTVDEDGNKSDKYPPRIRCKMMKTPDNHYTVQVYENRKKVPMDIYNYSSVLPKMSECTAIVDCASIWIVGEKFGVSFRPTQMKVSKNETSLKDYAFIEEENEDEAEDDDHHESFSSDNDLPLETETKMNNMTLEEPEGGEVDPLEENVVAEPSRRRRRA
jgi:hypothetical protein